MNIHANLVYSHTGYAVISCFQLIVIRVFFKCQKMPLSTALGWILVAFACPRHLVGFLCICRSRAICWTLFGMCASDFWLGLWHSSVSLYKLIERFNRSSMTEPRWQTVRGQFTAVNWFLIRCRCRYAIDGPAPAAHLGDGCCDLVIVRACSRFDSTRHLFRCTERTADQVCVCVTSFVSASFSSCRWFHVFSDINASVHKPCVRVFKCLHNATPSYVFEVILFNLAGLHILTDNDVISYFNLLQIVFA